MFSKNAIPRGGGRVSYISVFPQTLLSALSAFLWRFWTHWSDTFWHVMRVAWHKYPIISGQSLIPGLQKQESSSSPMPIHFKICTFPRVLSESKHYKCYSGQSQEDQVFWCDLLYLPYNSGQLLFESSLLHKGTYPAAGTGRQEKERQAYASLLFLWRLGVSFLVYF